MLKNYGICKTGIEKMNAKFNIGDTVYRGTYERHEKWVTCPDCLNSEVTPTPTPEIQPES